LVKTKEALEFGFILWSMVIQNILQLRIQKIEIRFTGRSAVRNRESSALQQDLRIL
jgi:hypothetical protein